MPGTSPLVSGHEYWGNKLWKVLLCGSVTNVLTEVSEVLYNAWHNKVLTLPRDMNHLCNTAGNTTISCYRNATTEMAFCISQ